MVLRATFCATSRPLDVAAATNSEATLGSACPISSMVWPTILVKRAARPGCSSDKTACRSAARSSELIAVKPVLHEGSDPMWGGRHASSQSSGGVLGGRKSFVSVVSCLRPVNDYHALRSHETAGRLYRSIRLDVFGFWGSLALLANVFSIARAFPTATWHVIGPRHSSSLGRRADHRSYR